MKKMLFIMTLVIFTACATLPKRATSVSTTPKSGYTAIYFDTQGIDEVYLEGEKVEGGVAYVKPGEDYQLKWEYLTDGNTSGIDKETMIAQKIKKVIIDVKTTPLKIHLSTNMVKISKK